MTAGCINHRETHTHTQAEENRVLFIIFIYGVYHVHFVSFQKINNYQLASVIIIMSSLLQMFLLSHKITNEVTQQDRFLFFCILLPSSLSPSSCCHYLSEITNNITIYKADYFIKIIIIIVAIIPFRKANLLFMYL